MNINPCCEVSLPPYPNNLHNLLNMAKTGIPISIAFITKTLGISPNTITGYPKHLYSDLDDLCDAIGIFDNDAKTLHDMSLNDILEYQQ